MNKTVVKINVYENRYHVSDVAYYRSNLTVAMVSRWRWYFEYLAALIKVNNKRMKVELIICGQDNMLNGKDYIEHKTKTLLSAKKGQIKRLKRDNSYKLNLFDFGKEEIESKIERISNEVESLEKGEFNYYVPVEYINKIKKYSAS